MLFVDDVGVSELVISVLVLQQELASFESLLLCWSQLKNFLSINMILQGAALECRL
jgi:hypothetical protein